MLLIVIMFIGALYAFYSVKGAGKGGSPPASATAKTAGPTPTASEIIPTPTQALFYETFQDNRNQWALSNAGGYVRELSGGQLVLTNTNPQTTMVESLPNEMTYKDFSVTVTFSMLGGDANDSVGIYVRGDSNLDHDYRIEISGTNTFDVAKEYLDSQSMSQVVTLDGPKTISALHPPSQLNTLTVTLQGPALSVSLNNMLISAVTDNDYASGQVALFVHHGTSSTGVTMSVSQIEIDRLG